jgi:aconitate hydratase
LIQEKGWKDEIKASLIGSCTNSSYEDMSKSVHIAQQAFDKGLSSKTPFLVTPGSEQIRATMERDGYTQKLTQAGAQVLANACGPCIGQWKRTDLPEEEKSVEENAILTSFNRNFRGRNDGHAKTMNFLASPELVTAMAFSGKLSFNPQTDTLLDAQGKPFQFEPPQGQDLPLKGFDQGRPDFRPSPPQPEPSLPITIDPSSSRLQVLEPFQPWDGQEFKDLRVLVKVQGKCTTDHISAAGPWLKYKGHLENIANNTLIGALNAFNQKINLVKNERTGKEDSIPEVGKDYKAHSIPWAVIADHNYGEGSAREHAALQPRFLGCKMIVSKSFARIHETNLKKQGVLPATFENPEDYDLITEGCRLSTEGLTELAPGSALTLTVTYPDGSAKAIALKHTMSVDQIEYFKAGSALNMIAAQQKGQ